MVRGLDVVRTMGRQATATVVVEMLQVQLSGGRLLLRWQMLERL